MKGIATFYTWFWVIYFPTCLAFQKFTGFDFSDELLCIVMMGFGFLMWKRRRKDKKIEKEMWQYWGIMAFYTIYSFSVSITTFRGISLDILQQIRPYMVFYMTFLLAPHFPRKQKRLIVGSMLLTMVGYFITADVISNYEAGNEEGDLPMVALTTGMSYYLFMKANKRNMYIAIAIMFVGLLSGKSKYMGQCICFIGIVLFLKEKVNYRKPKYYIMLVSLASIVIFFTWTKFNSYYVEGMQNDTEQQMARPASYKTAFGKIIWEYFPFGSGFGSFSTAAAAKEYSPLYHKYDLDEIWGMTPDFTGFMADCFYPSLAEYGVVGIFLFCVFWRRRLIEIKRIDDERCYKMALMAILALAIDSTSNTAYLSGGGMGLFMTLAICLNSNRKHELRVKRVSSNENGTPSNDKRQEAILQ